MLLALFKTMRPRQWLKNGIIFANRQHILAIEPWGKGMLGTTLRFDHEVRDEKEFFRGIGSHRVPKEMVSLASHILDAKAGHFDPAKFKEYQDAQNSLSGALGRLLVTVERYPDLKSNQNFLALQSQLEGTENRIAVAELTY